MARRFWGVQRHAGDPLSPRCPSRLAWSGVPFNGHFSPFEAQLSWDLASIMPALIRSRLESFWVVLDPVVLMDEMHAPSHAQTFGYPAWGLC